MELTAAEDEWRGAKPSFGGAALLSAMLFCGACSHIPQQSPAAISPLAPYTASIQIRATAHGRGALLSAGCAVDPASGARVEIRDNMGGTRLLVLLKPSSALLFNPDSGESARWSELDSSLPWSPLDLWTLLAATPPPHGESIKYDNSGRLAACEWRGAGGGRRARFVRSTGGFPYASAMVDGPMGARLTVEWRKADFGAIPAEVLAGPPGAGTEAVSASSLLDGLLP